MTAAPLWYNHRMHRALLLALLAASLLRCQQIDTPTGILLVGLSHSSCEDGTLLFGTVPLLAVPLGPGDFNSVTFMIEGQDPIHHSGVGGGRAETCVPRSGKQPVGEK